MSIPKVSRSADQVKEVEFPEPVPMSRSEAMQLEHLEALKTNRQMFVNQTLLTEHVRSIAIKAGLENLTKTAINEVQYGIIEIMQQTISELVGISRQHRSLNAVVNSRTTIEG